MRAANMQALTNDLYGRYPGVTIYGVGDAAHKLSPSDHNEDDTPGSLPEQQDADNVPEHRAIDVMLSGPFLGSEAEALVKRMVADPATQRRLRYIIWNRRIYSASYNWNPTEYIGSDPHTNHVHISGLASNDEDASSWPIVYGSAAPVSPTGKRKDMRPFIILQPGSGGIVIVWPSEVARAWVWADIRPPGAGNVDAPALVDAYLAAGCIDGRNWGVANLSAYVALNSVPGASVEVGEVSVALGNMKFSGEITPE